MSEAGEPRDRQPDIKPQWRRAVELEKKFQRMAKESLTRFRRSAMSRDGLMVRPQVVERASAALTAKMKHLVGRGYESGYHLGLRQAQGEMADHMIVLERRAEEGKPYIPELPDFLVTGLANTQAKLDEAAEYLMHGGDDKDVAPVQSSLLALVGNAVNAGYTDAYNEAYIGMLKWAESLPPAESLESLPMELFK